MSLRVYGISACDTCRKARRWLDEQGIGYEYRDLREDALSARELTAWLREVGSERLVNRRSTTWRQLPAERRPSLDADDLADVLADYPTMIKRPVFVRGGDVRVGFDAGVREWMSSG